MTPGNQQDLLQMSCLCVSDKTFAVFLGNSGSIYKKRQKTSETVKRKVMTGGGRKAGIKSILKKKQMLSEKQTDRA